MDTIVMVVVVAVVVLIVVVVVVVVVVEGDGKAPPLWKTENVNYVSSKPLRMSYILFSIVKFMF